ncbi:MAG: autotransporter-associated beta strand repeat-containing protein, partial [Verrucomicrobiota bacterium]
VNVSAGTLTVGGSIGGAYALTKAGNGVLTLGGANTYTGATNLSAGTLNLNHASALSAASVLTITGGAIDNTSGAALTLGNNSTQTWSGNFTFKGSNDLNMGSGAVTLGGSVSLTVGAGTLEEGGVIGGTYSLSKAGNGALTLSGANTFSGGLTLSVGTLNVNNAMALGDASSVLTISGGALNNTSGAAIVLANNNSQVWNGNFSFLGANDLDLGLGSVTLGANRTVTVSAGTLTVGGDISGVYGMTKAGAGKMLLTGANSFTGATLVSAGTLQIGNGGSSGSLSSLSTLTNNATLVFAVSGTLTQGTDFAPSITGTGTLIQQGPGTLVLTDANSYTGATLISGGTLQIGVGGIFGGISASSSLTNNATLVFNRSDTLIQGTDFAPSIGGTGSLRQEGAGSLVLSGTNSYTGPTVIAAGVLQLGNGGLSGRLSTSSVITNNAVLAFNRSNVVTQGTDFASTVGGSGKVQQLGAGTLVLSGVNTYTGGTTLSAGRVNINNSAALGSGLFTIEGGSFDNTSGGAIRLSADNTQAWAGDFTFIGSQNIDLGSGSVALSANRVVTVNAGTLAVGGTISGAYTLSKAGLGILKLEGATAFSGKTSVNAGTLLVSNNAALQNSAYNTNSAGTLVFGAGVTQPILGGLTGSGNFAPGSGVTTLTLNPGLGFTQTYSGVLSGSLDLIKAGAGVQILTGSSTYTGSLTVSAGMLKLAGVAGVSSNSDVFIASGARFYYTPNSTSLASGTLNVRSLSMAPDSVLGVKWGKTIELSTAPSFTGTIRLNMTGAFSSQVETYTVLTAPGGLDLANYYISPGPDYTSTVIKTATSLVIRPTQTAGLPAAYWVGGIVTDDPLTWTSSNFTIDGSLNIVSGTSNWKTDALGMTPTNLIPGASTEVYLTGLASAGSLSMFADADMALKGLTVTTIHPVTLSDVGGSTLFLGSSGVTVSGTAGAVNLAPAIELKASQTWTNQSVHEMVLSGMVNTGTSSFALSIEGSGNIALQGGVTGDGSLTMSGAGTLTVSGVNTYTGATVINSGTLQIGAGGAGGSLLGTASIANNASLVFNQTDLYGGSMNMVISGTGSVSLWNGVLTLAAANTYTGGTKLVGGQLNLAGGNDRLSTSGTIALLSGVLDLGGYSQSTSGNVLLLGGTLQNGTLTATGSDYDAQAGLVAGVLSGTYGLTKTANTTLTLSGANTYTGGTVVRQGTLV